MELALARSARIYTKEYVKAYETPNYDNTMIGPISRRIPNI